MRNERFTPRSVSYETYNALAREYPHENTDQLIVDIAKAAKARRKRERADWFHKNIYRKVSKGLGAAVDKTRLPITDMLITFGAPYVIVRAPDIVTEEPVRTIIPESIQQALAPWDVVPEAVKPYIDTPVAATVVAGVVFGVSYFVNKDRTPPSEKLHLEAKDYDPREQVDRVIQKLNERIDAPRLSFDDIATRSSDAVGDFLERVDGYRTESTRRVKKVLPFKWIYNLARIHGSFNPSVGEIALQDETMQYAPAHEMAHAKGVFREAEAEFVGTAALIESGDPSLEYVGYSHWLDSLLNTTGFSTEQRLHILQHRGLNQTTLHELEAYWKHLDEKAKRKLRRTRAVARTIYEATIPEKIRSRIAHTRYHMHPRNIILRGSGQEDFLTAYTDRPLQLLAAYTQNQQDSSDRSG